MKGYITVREKEYTIELEGEPILALVNKAKEMFGFTPRIVREDMILLNEESIRFRHESSDSVTCEVIQLYPKRCIVSGICIDTDGNELDFIQRGESYKEVMNTLSSISDKYQIADYWINDEAVTSVHCLIDGVYDEYIELRQSLFGAKLSESDWGVVINDCIRIIEDYTQQDVKDMKIVLTHQHYGDQKTIN